MSTFDQDTTPTADFTELDKALKSVSCSSPQAETEEVSSLPSQHKLVFADAESVVLAAETGKKSAPFEPAAVAILRGFKGEDAAGWARMRVRLRNSNVGITELEKLMNSGGGAQAPEEAESVADKLIKLARKHCHFIRDEQGEAYAVFHAAGARQVYAVSCSGFSDFLSHTYYIEQDRAPTETSLKVALTTLRGQARFDGETCSVFMRVAKTTSGYWLDLCNDAWECVHITANGWAVVAGEGAPLFSRSTSMRPLPIPIAGGTLNDLWPLVNIPESDRLMIVTWLLECLRADTPHVVLELIGEQGSAKSSTQRFIRRLVDPNHADLRAAPKTVEDVWIAARNSHIVSLENMSQLQAQYQDALCMLATGGGYATRTLYTNADETIIDLQKPIVINGISVIVTAQDLLDRCLHIDLPTIQSRELAGTIDLKFDAAWPRLLGALLDQFTYALAKLPDVTIAPELRPRMADFAFLGEAVFRVNGRQPGEFLERYESMRKEGVHRTIDSSPVGAALLAYLSKMPAGWEGTLSMLLVKLKAHQLSGEVLPRSAKGLGDALRRLAPALRLIGYECKSEGKTGGNIKWRIHPTTPLPNPSLEYPPCPISVNETPEKPDTGDSKTSGHTGIAGHAPGSLGARKNNQVRRQLILPVSVQATVRSNQ